MHLTVHRPQFTTEEFKKSVCKLHLQICVMIHSGSRGLGHQVADGCPGRHGESHEER